MKITEQQAVECMAEMMGYTVTGVKYKGGGIEVYRETPVVDDPIFGNNSGRSNLNPLHDANHALECLEAYCDNPRLWKQGGWWHVVILENDVYKDPWQASHPDPNYAAITALCSAQMGVQVEITPEGDE